MADLEEHALKRDKSFLVRLVWTLVVAGVIGVLIGGRLTSEGAAGCAADTALEGSDAAPAERSQPGK